MLILLTFDFSPYFQAPETMCSEDQFPFGSRRWEPLAFGSVARSLVVSAIASCTIL